MSKSTWNYDRVGVKGDDGRWRREDRGGTLLWDFDGNSRNRPRRRHVWMISRHTSRRFPASRRYQYMALPYMQIYFKPLGVLRVSRAQYVVLYRKPYYVIRYIIILLLYVARQYRFGARRLCRCVYPRAV